MAILPSQLNDRLTASIKGLADAYEKKIDAFMDSLTELDADGSFTFDQLDPDDMSPALLTLLRQRYGGSRDDGWEIRYEDAAPEEMEFIPRRSGGPVSGRLDR